MRLWKRRLAAAALGALLAGLPAGASWADPLAPQTSWQLRAQVRPKSGTPLSGPRQIGDAVGLMHQAACARAQDQLGDGKPAGTKVELTLWRQAGPADQTRAQVPDVRCEAELLPRSAFRLKAWVTRPKDPGRRITNGPMSLASAVRLAAQVANDLADQVLATGGQPWITIRMAAREKRVREMIRSLSQRHQVDTQTALRVAACESKFNPKAFNHPYAGLYQQDIRRWPSRARHFGHPGASAFDPFANTDVSLRMARASGWSHWGCA
jgi:hypothetical protein